MRSGLLVGGDVCSDAKGDSLLHAAQLSVRHKMIPSLSVCLFRLLRFFPAQLDARTRKDI